MIENKYIENLLERFFEGETSNKEEQELYLFFKEHNLPEHLEKYRSIFGYFENGIPEVQIENELPLLHIEKKKKLFNKQVWLSIASAVACILILLAINPFSDKPFNPYEGSYIVENGIKIHDMDKIMERYEKMESLMEQKEKQIENIIYNKKDY